VHDIGEVFLSNYLKDDFKMILDNLSDVPNSFHKAEAELLGTTHCEIGLCLARHWNFPKDYQDAIYHHHAPVDADTDPVLVAIVNLADLFCFVRQLGYDGKGWVEFDLASEEAWGILLSMSPALATIDVERFCFELDERVPEIEDLVNSLFET
jgi:HD-like signal output (HDOD) protein